MKFTLSWLKDHLDTTATLDEIVEQLVKLGLEVDSVTDPAAQLAGFVVGYVESAEQHPDADRLRLCRVNAGDGELLQVVCGAPNARAGMKVAFAPLGVTIPSSGDKLKKGKIRGVESFGMMCSADELQLGEESDGILDLEIPDQPGTPLSEALQLNDPVIDIELTPNRADCFSVRGIARDLAAAGLGELKPVNYPIVEGAGSSEVTVNIADNKDCAVFFGRLIKGVKNCASPEWVRRRLTAIGLRPLNALVDITNYICFDLGRPMHVYDADKLSGNISVRRGKEGEKFLGLDEKEYDVDPEMIVIADDSGAIGLGGIMGGESTGCDQNTENVFIESALFDAVQIAKTGQRTNIISDSRMRFERGVDPETTELGIRAATQFVIDWCGGQPQVGPVIKTGDATVATNTISLDLAKLNRLSGANFTLEQAVKYLTGLGFEVNTSGDSLTVVPPAWRMDMQHDVDLVEEIVRLHGYDNIEVAKLMPISKSDNRKDLRDTLRITLAGRGLSEAISFSFLDAKSAKLFAATTEQLITVANPISQDMSTMRPSVLPSLIQAVVRNQARGLTETNLFEIGSQFSKSKSIDEHRVVAGVRSGLKLRAHWATGQEKVDVFDVKADVLAALREAGFDARSVQVVAEAPEHYHPGRSGAIKQGKKVLAYFGQLHPGVLKAMKCKTAVVGFEIFVDEIPQRRGKIKPLSLSQYQTVERDFAFIVDSGVEAGKLVQLAQGADRNLINNVDIFDVYIGEPLAENEKSVALRVKLEPKDATLNDEQISQVSEKIITAINKSTGGVLRQS